MGKLRHTTFAGKKERDIISASAEISRGNVDKGAGIIKDFRDTVKLTMQEKGYGTKEVSGAELSVDEIVPDALNYCEPCTLTAAANITSKYALMKFSWRQAEGADLAEIERVREAELEELKNSEDPEAYAKSLFARMDEKEAAGKIGGAGGGLVLVKKFCDNLASFYNPSSHTMLVITRIENKGRNLSKQGDD